MGTTYWLGNKSSVSGRLGGWKKETSHVSLEGPDSGHGEETHSSQREKKKKKSSRFKLTIPVTVNVKNTEITLDQKRIEKGVTIEVKRLEDYKANSVVVGVTLEKKVKSRT